MLRTGCGRGAAWTTSRGSCSASGQPTGCAPGCALPGRWITLAHGFEGFLVDPAGAEPWTLPVRTLLSNPEEHLQTLLRAIETVRPA